MQVIKFSDPQPADGSPLDSLLTLTSAALMVLRRHGDKEEELQDLVVQVSCFSVIHGRFKPDRGCGGMVTRRMTCRAGWCT